MTNLSSLLKLCLSSTALSGAMALAVTPALAQDRTFNIPAGDLHTALRAYETASGQTVSIDGASVTRRTTRGVQGAMSSSQALSRLLAGTRLTACPNTAGVSIVSDARGCGVSQAGSSDAVEVADVIVTATAVSHLADRSRTGTRMDADPLSLPLSVSTVSEELIQRQQALSLADATANVAGVTSGSEGAFQMRGFSANIMKNGNLNADFRSNDLPIVALSRIEVVKGPEAIIAGLSAGYGGVVNVITKTPPNKPTAEVVSTIGSRGYYDFGFDIGGPLNTDRTVLVRLVGSTQDADRTPAGYDGSSMDYVAPSVTYRLPNWGTEFTAQYEYQKLHTAPATVVFGRPGDTELSDDLKIYRFGAERSGQDIEGRTLTLALEQRINDNWSVALRYSDDQQDRISNLPSTFRLESMAPYPELVTIAFDGYTEGNIQTTKVELKGKFETGPISHSLLAAYDTAQSAVLVGSRSAEVYSTNIETGVRRDRSADIGVLFGIPSPQFAGGSKPEERGLLLLDQMTWGKWVVLAGVRQIKYDLSVLNRPDVAPFEETLPSLGIVYKATPTLSFYANASKGFQANQGVFTVSGDPVEPEFAQQFEVGGKALLFNEKIAASIALYAINQKNVATPDDANQYPTVICAGNSQCYINIPGVKTKGAEFEISGELLPRLEVRANYTYTDKDVDPLYQANTQFNRHQGSVWATYNFGDSKMGWWTGVGVQARSARSDTGSADDLGNPGQVRIDLNAGYDTQRWSALFGVKNVADARLYDAFSGSLGTGAIVQTREFFATLRYRIR